MAGLLTTLLPPAPEAQVFPAFAAFLASSAATGWPRGRDLQLAGDAFPAHAPAEAFLTAAHSRDPLAVRVGTFPPLFPHTPADIALVAEQARLRDEVQGFHAALFKAKQAMKTRLWTCGHCDSAINLKEHTGRLPYGRLLTDCPVCAKPFLLSATDEKAYHALRARQREVAARVSAAQKAHERRHPVAGVGWLVGVWVP